MRHTPPTPAVPDAPPDFARMAEADADGVFLFDPDLRRRYVNLEAERIAGLPHDALTEPPCALLDPDDFLGPVQGLNGRAGGSSVCAPLVVLALRIGAGGCAAAAGEPRPVVRCRAKDCEGVPASGLKSGIDAGSLCAATVSTFGPRRDLFLGYAGMARGAARP